MKLAGTRMGFQSARVIFVAAFALIFFGCSGGGGAADNPATPVDPFGCASTSSPAASGTINLSWDAVTAANLAGYRVYYGTASGNYLQAAGQGLDAGNFTAYTVTGLNRGSRYYLAVKAYDASNAESPYSNEVCKTVQ